MQEFQKMISGEFYNPECNYLRNMRAEARKLTSDFNLEKDETIRTEMLSSLLGKTGKGCFITPPVFFDYGKNTELGKNVYMNFNCVILDCAPVKIGDNTFLGPNVQIYTPTHPLDYKSRNKGLESAKSITIGKNCWIGGGAIILPGVSIGDGCVIGAGSVVTKNIPQNSVAVGNPAKVIKTIEQ